MHYVSTCTLLIIVLITISARSTPLTKPPVNDYRLCPEEYRNLRRRQDEASAEMDDDDDDNDVNESLENVCEQAIVMIARHHNIAKLNPSLFLSYCPHYDQRLALVRENNNTLCAIKKQEVRRKQSDNDDDKRRALRKREFKKRFALRFIRKRMS